MPEAIATITIKDLPEVRDIIDALKQELLERTIAHEEEIGRNQQLTFILDRVRQMACMNADGARTIIEMIDEGWLKSWGARLAQDCADVIAPVLLEALEEPPNA